MVKKEIKYASFSQRLLAHNIDLIPILIIFYIGSFFLPNIGMDWVFFSLLYIVYNTSFEMSKWKATPGKKQARIYVASEKGSLSLFQSLIRNASKVISLVLFFGGYLLMLFNVKKKALHDYLALICCLYQIGHQFSNLLLEQ